MDDEFYHLYGDEEYDQATIEDVELSKCCNHPVNQQPGHFLKCSTIKARKATMVKLIPFEPDPNEHPHWCKCQRVCGGDQ